MTNSVPKVKLLRLFSILILTLPISAIGQIATLVSEDLTIFSPAVRISENSFQLELQHESGHWRVSEILFTESELESGSYENSVLSLNCIYYERDYYAVSLRLISGSDPGVLMFYPESIFQIGDCGEFTPISEIEFLDPEFADCIDSTAAEHHLFFAEEVKSLNCRGMGIASTDGIELLKNLQSLDLASNELQRINIISLENLVSLDISNNLLRNIALHRNTKLESLDLSNNQLTFIDLSLNLELGISGSRVNLRGNPLSEFGISQLISIDERLGGVIDRDINISELTYSVGDVLYNIDFSAPTHVLGSTVSTSDDSDTPTRTIFGNPVVVNQEGILSNNSLLFNSNDSQNGYEQIELAIDRRYDQYFISFEIYHENLSGIKNNFSVLFDTPQVRNLKFSGLNNTISTFIPFIGSQFLEPISDGISHSVILSLDLVTESWDITIDNKLFATRDFRANSIESIRFSLAPAIVGSDGDLSKTNVYLDNVIVSTALEDILEPPQRTLKGCVDETASVNQWQFTFEVIALECSFRGILTTNDLEQFANLEELYIDSNFIQLVDISKNSELKVLDLSNNEISNLDITFNTELEFLNVSNNPLTESAIDHLVTIGDQRGIELVLD